MSFGRVDGNAPGFTDCWGRFTGLHETMHTMGAAQHDAPAASPGYHCNDGLDYLCYPDGSNNGVYSSSSSSICQSRELDCRGDTYLDTYTEPNEYLRTHWNIGWNGNYFLQLSP